MQTIVVTRPNKLATPWIDAMQSHGLSVMHVPLLQISNAGEEKLIKKAWEEIDRWSWVMFVSPNAAHHFTKYAQGRAWPKHLRVGSPGEGTTQTLIQLGIPQTLIDQPEKHQEKDTEFLWQNIKNRNWHGTKVLLVRGISTKPARDWLTIQLQEAGAFVQPLVVYQRESGIFSDAALQWIKSEQAQQACWIITSSESLNALTGYDWSRATAVVIHPRIAKVAQQAGFGKIICTQPDLNSVIHSVESVV